MEKIRKPTVAGMFYPGNENVLSKNIETLLNQRKITQPAEKIFGIIAPHAGYRYSGKTAAAVYNLIAGEKYETVVIISPSHREYFPGACVYDGDAYQTPLGVMHINKNMRDELVKDNKIIFAGENGHKQEHALEVQLPFLQSVLKNFTIVPIVMGDQGKVYCDELSERLAEVIDENTLIVASTDLSHFYSKEKAGKLDSVIADKINNFDFEGLQKDIDDRTCEACGAGPIITLMKTAKIKNINKAKVISRTDSGDVTGDDSEVVGYLSAIVY